MIMRNIEKILFGYYNCPSCGYFGVDDGGFSIDIFPDGKLNYTTYIFDKKEKTRQEYMLSVKTIDKIKKVLDENKAVIESFDEHTDNGSCDGNGHFFVFYGKEFITWNIEYHDEDELRKSNQPYYNEYINVIRQENKMIIIFSKITEILEDEGMYLNLHTVSFNQYNDNKKHGLTMLFSVGGDFYIE